MLFQGLVGLSEAMYLWLVAAGLSLIFGVMRVLNFAHGSLYMLGAYFAWVAFRISGSFWVALVVGPLLVAAAIVGFVAWYKVNQDYLGEYFSSFRDIYRYVSFHLK